MPLVKTRGAASAQGFGEFAQAATAANYIEDVFSTYLYTGNDTTQTINNGLQLGGTYTSGGTGGSGLFNGTTGYLSVPTGSALNLPGDFTIEAYVYLTDYANLPSLFGNGDYPTSAQVAFAPISGGYIAVYMANGTSWGFTMTSSVPIPLSTWTHVALTCSGSTFTIWFNGISTATGTYSGTRVTPAATSVIGRIYSSTNNYYWTGSISNFRVVKGTALYTSNFTVSSSALTAVSGTQLLCLQGTTPFVDNSTNALTITVNGGTTASTSGPFPYSYTAGKGGLVWLKCRTTAYWNNLTDTARGAGYNLWSNDTAASTAVSNGLISFGNGFTLGGYGNTNGSAGGNYVSWSFAEQAKFFDIVTYTGNATNRTIAHNLGSAPGMIIVKATSSAGFQWTVYHRSLGGTKYLYLNTTDSVGTYSAYWNNTDPTSTVFSLGVSGDVNGSGTTYVAYLFAHDAGGFGTTGTDNVISCGSFTGTATVNLGYEPQYLLYKPASGGTGNWIVADVMRGFNASPTLANPLFPNLDIAEVGQAFAAYVNSTGFTVSGNAGVTYIYMAIRRGPMKVPTTGTSVFSPLIRSGNSTSPTVVTTPNFAVDMQISAERTKTLSGYTWAVDKLRGNTVYLPTNRNDSEYTYNDAVIAFTNLGFNLGDGSLSNAAGGSYVYWNFGRAPGFFDQVCYTGTGSNTTQAHNLGVVPELMIVKRRNTLDNWTVYAQPLGNTSRIFLNSANAVSTGQTTTWNSTSPTSSVFSIGTNTGVNASGSTYVAYLFATLAGISKVGSFTGNGTTQAIACGFTGGARFVLIKRTDATGDWYVYDTARGMTTLTDPYLLLNDTAAETATLGSVTTTTGGFTVNGAILAAINTNAASYIFLAIA